MRDLGTRGPLVLAVVQHDEKPLLAERPLQGFDQRCLRLLAHPQRRCQSLRHARALAQRCQVHEPHPVGIIHHRALGDFERQPRLAAPGRSGEREQPRLREEVATRGDLRLAPDEGSPRMREIVRRGRERGGATDRERPATTQDRFQLRARGIDAGKTLLRILLEALREELPDAGGDASRQGGPPRLVSQHGRDHDLRGLALERAHAREALEQHAPERERIGPAVLREAADLLGTHVARRAHRLAHARKPRSPGTGRRLGGGRLRPRAPGPPAAGQAEIQHLHEAVRGDHDVPGLEIAVDHALGMRERQRFRDLRSDRQRLHAGDGTPIQLFPQRGPVDHLHRQKVHVLIGVEVVDRRDVGVVQVREGEGFAPEALAGVVALEHPGGQDLERHLALEPRVAGLVDDAHSAFPDLPEDAVMGNLLADQAGHRHGVGTPGRDEGDDGALGTGSPITARTKCTRPSSRRGIAVASTVSPSSSTVATPRQRCQGFSTVIS